MTSISTPDLQSLYTVQRFENVTGDQDKQNDLILCFPSAINPIKCLSKTVIFFGGDVQVIYIRILNIVQHLEVFSLVIVQCSLIILKF